MPTAQEFSRDLLSGLQTDRFVRWVRDDASSAKEWLAGRSAIAVGGGFPRGAGIDGALLQRGSGGESISRSQASEAATRLDLKSTLEPSCLRDRLAFFVKDCSPDSLLAVFVVLARCAGVDLGASFNVWRDEVDGWDRGRMPAESQRCWSALVSALAHASFPDQVPADRAARSDELQRFAAAWQKSFAFLLQSIAQSDDPGNMPLHGRAILHQAQAVLARQRQTYEDCLRHAVVQQLSLPLAATPQRQITVDCLFVVEHEFSDALKLFARHDSHRAPGRHGFGLVASYRPQAEDWNQFTIFTDPALGVDLTRIWVALEREETKRWRKDAFIERIAGPVTPVDAGALYASFTGDDLARLLNAGGQARPLSGVANCWQNPWYIAPDGSLVGSPGKDVHGTRAGGTRLGWQDVMTTIWRVGRPLGGVRLRSVDVSGTTGPECPLLAVTPMQYGSSPSAAGPFVRWVEWPRDSEVREPGIASTADLALTAQQMLATLASSAGPCEDMQLPELALPGSFEMIELNGGFAVVSRHGCVLVDDWRDVALEKTQMLTALLAARHLSSVAQSSQEICHALGEDFRRLRRKRTDVIAKPLLDVLDKSAAVRAEVADGLMQSTVVGLTDPSAQRLFYCLLERWDAKPRLVRAEADASRIESATRGLIEARSGLALRMLSFYGIPLAVASAVSQPLMSLVNAGLLLWPGPQFTSEQLASDLRNVGVGVAFVVVTWVCYAFIRHRFGGGDPKEVPRPPNEPH